ncbi:MAG: glucan 1,4-alpha-glucosidase [Acidobacteria bacterium]|nr:glucan 1,4-alpha-glucosidase [Acidobacteriota bacterium]
MRDEQAPANRAATTISYAPGWPGIEPRWTSSAKSGIGTALNRESRVWFTLSHGILNEAYFPEIDQACTRDLGLIVTDGARFLSEEKRHATHETTWLADGVPAFRLVNRCTEGRYRIEKEILTDPARPVLLQRTRFVAVTGAPQDYRLYALLAPHLANHGAGNTAWMGEHEGQSMLFAERDGCALALASSSGWLARSVGFVGVSDGWQDLVAHKQMTWHYDRAENGNVAVTGQIRVPDDDGTFVLALGFGSTPTAAARAAAASLHDGFDQARDRYLREWQAWQATLTPIAPSVTTPGAAAPRGLDATSAAVIRTCESKAHPGGIVASLSLPWGFNKGDGDLGGYHLVWPRDLVETAGALLAIGASDDVRQVLRYLQATQADDGHWPQNMWIDGTPYWNGLQLDETAFPILLADLMQRERELSPDELTALWPMLRRAAAFLVTHGPVTEQDRWEEDPGYSTFTLAVSIVALLAAADLADAQGEPTTAASLRDTADDWNGSIERWCYVTDTALARQVGVDGYYVRLTPPDVAEAASPSGGFVAIKNRPPGEDVEPASLVICPDALALVRFGLRAPDDPHIVNTVAVIDALLEVETPQGPAWHRYNDDGYGEHADGAPFDGVGIGRAWPLLTGERAHYELAAGRPAEALRLLGAMEAFANDGGLIPEQIWDGDDLPALELFRGRPAGSAMPLVWAHAEYLKLRRSLQDGRVFDLPGEGVARYLGRTTAVPRAVWRFSHRLRSLPAGRVLRVEVRAPAIVHWSADDWQTVHDMPTIDTGLGLHVADLPAGDAVAGVRVRFTFRWLDANRWEGTDFDVPVN